MINTNQKRIQTGRPHLQILIQHSFRCIDIYGTVIPSLMYCDNTVMCFNHPSAVSVTINLLNRFTTMSGLGFTFDRKGILNQVFNFLCSLSSKYHKIKQLRLSPIGISQFVNSYHPLKSFFLVSMRNLYNIEMVRS
eukprot:TRINITY_DN3244_c0_g1_i44.p2 TRINITY_DN3244_c0_g1~~TRINITY_DN3244_c0_g1_i44.p2  ORF type:complete len:136 (+),score=2.96 TRINITY_DN3244_c0_g1_i44:1423-1830(+)